MGDASIHNGEPLTEANGGGGRTTTTRKPTFKKKVLGKEACEPKDAENLVDKGIMRRELVENN